MVNTFLTASGYGLGVRGAVIGLPVLLRPDHPEPEAGSCRVHSWRSSHGLKALVDQSAQTCPGPCGRFSLVKDLSCLCLFHTSVAPVAFSLSLLYRWPNCPVRAHLYLISQACYLLCPECLSTHTHAHHSLPGLPQLLLWSPLPFSCQWPE